MGMPIKNKDNPHGLFTDQELYDMITLLFTVSVLDVQPEHSWALEYGASQVAKVIQQIVGQNVDASAAVRVSPSISCLG